MYDSNWFPSRNLTDTLGLAGARLSSPWPYLLVYTSTHNPPSPTLYTLVTPHRPRLLDSKSPLPPLNLPNPSPQTKYLLLCASHFPSFPITHIGVAPPTLCTSSPNSPRPKSIHLHRPPPHCSPKPHLELKHPPYSQTVNKRSVMRWGIRVGLDGVITGDSALFLDVCEAVDGGKAEEDRVELGMWMRFVGLNMLVFLFAPVVGWLGGGWLEKGMGLKPQESPPLLEATSPPRTADGRPPQTTPACHPGYCTKTVRDLAKTNLAKVRSGTMIVQGLSYCGGNVTATTRYSTASST